MIEVAQILRSEAGQKSVESGFNIKLIENNKMIVKLFNGDKFPLLLELNESKEVSFLDDLIAICIILFDFLWMYSW